MEVYLGCKIFLFFNASLYQINSTIINVIFIVQQIAQLVKNLPAMQKTPIQFLGQENLPEKG